MGNIFNHRLLGLNTEINRSLERLRDAAQQQTLPFPKYNLYSSDDGSHVIIEVAVAGFSKTDITITQDTRTLSIKGVSPKTSLISEELRPVHKGISSKDFSLSWNINNGLEVQSAEITNGILIVTLRSHNKDDKIRVITID